jgi:hypothetical protein
MYDELVGTLANIDRLQRFFGMHPDAFQTPHGLSLLLAIVPCYYGTSEKAFKQFAALILAAPTSSVITDALVAICSHVRFFFFFCFFFFFFF